MVTFLSVAQEYLSSNSKVALECVYLYIITQRESL
jgi:hypothetical protein